MIRIDGEGGEFAVNSFYLGRIMEESDARRARASVHHFLPCARHGTSLTGESPVTGIYRQV